MQPNTNLGTCESFLKTCFSFVISRLLSKKVLLIQSELNCTKKIYISEPTVYFNKSLLGKKY